MANKQPLNRPELTPFIEELRAFFRRRDWSSAAERVAELQKVGIRIDSQYGYEGMVNVCDSLRAAGDPIGARELEGLWDGIGEWRR